MAPTDSKQVTKTLNEKLERTKEAASVGIEITKATAAAGLEKSKVTGNKGLEKTKVATAAGLEKSKVAGKKFTDGLAAGVNWIKAKYNCGKSSQKKKTTHGNGSGGTGT